MFVLSNAWRALTRSKGRTALTAFITLAVTFGTVAGLAIIQEDTNAHTTAYDQQKATLAIRPTAATWKKVSATDQSSTRHYMTWSTYNEYAALIQSAVSSLNFTFTETAPARVNGDLKALDGGSLGTAGDDATGGRLTTYRVSPLTEATLPSWRTIVLHNKVTFQGYTLTGFPFSGITKGWLLLISL